MSLLLRYIVFLFLTFNMFAVNAAEVIFMPDEEDIENIAVPSFIAAGNLPHPVQLRQMIDRKDNSPLGRLFILGQYFESRYPGDALNVDFREDVALIFPEMTEKEVEKTTGYIKTAIRLYRLSKDKIKEIKEEKIAPKDPPLVLSDDEYALLGDREYVKTDDNEVAIISDFKKVVGYSGNPREVEATEAYVDRVHLQHKQETDYEHFRSMIKKLDWRALTSYGVTHPSPFVGKAGIGDFVENEDFKVRLLSDTARIGSNKEMIFGLHAVVPNHRFMLATNLTNEMQKPKIELISSENVADMQVFEPMPLPAFSSEMIGVYRGNFAFPLKITLTEPNKPVYLKAKITFESCDADFDCQTIDMAPDLAIDAKEEGRPVWSSMSNFIHQSLYNLPKDGHKNFVLENASYTTNEAGNAVKLNFDFKYDGKINNFAFFLENEAATIFTSPEVIIGNDHIYIQIEPLENFENLLKKPLVLTARLNDFVSVRQTIDFKKGLRQNFGYGWFSVFVLGLVCGVLFYLSPFGWPVASMGFWGQKNIEVKLKFLLSKLLFFAVFIFLFEFWTADDSNVVYTLFAPGVFEMVALFFALVILLLYLKKELYEKINAPFVFGAAAAVLVALVLIVCGVPNKEQFWTAYTHCDVYGRAVLFGGVLIGLAIPDFCALYLRNVKINAKVAELLMAFSKMMIGFALAILGLWLIWPLSFKNTVIVFCWLVGGMLILQYLFAFWQALYRTDLKPSYIKWTSRIGFLLILGASWLFGSTVQKSADRKETPVPAFQLNEIMSRAQNGENMIVALDYPSCLLCRYNRWSVFRPAMLEKLKKDYQLTYLGHNSEKPDAVTIDFMKKYKRFARPLYVLYTPLAPGGVVLPDKLDVSSLEDVFEMFRIYPSSSASESKKSRATDLR